MILIIPENLSDLVDVAPGSKMKRATDAVIDLTADSSIDDDEPKVKKQKTDENNVKTFLEAQGEIEPENNEIKEAKNNEVKTAGTNASIDLTKDEDEEKCKICGFMCSSYTVLRAHMYTEHREASEGAGGSSGQKELFCDLCQVKSTSEATHEEHMRGGRHRKNMRNKPQPPAKEGNISNFKQGFKTFFCDTCKVSLINLWNVANFSARFKGLYLRSSKLDVLIAGADSEREPVLPPPEGREASEKCKAAEVGRNTWGNIIGQYLF